MPTSLQVLSVHPLGELYGSDRMLLESLAAVLEQGGRCELILAESGPLVEEADREGVPVRVVEFPVVRKALLNPGGLFLLAVGLIPTVLRLRRLIRKWQPDLLYVNTLTMPHWLLAGRLARVPVLCHVREAEDANGMLSRALHLPLAFADALVANSHYTAASIRRAWPFLGRRTSVVYNGFDLPDAVAEQPPLAPPITLTLVGRLSPRKGQDVALDALALLRTEGRDCRLRFVGSTFRGYEWWEHDLIEQTARLGLEDHVEFCGLVEDRWACFAGTDIALVPSMVEPFGNVAVEAMALGLPVVASRVGGLAEIVLDGETGLQVPAGDAPALAAAIEKLLDDPELAREMGRRGIESAHERFTAERYHTEIVATMRRTAGASRLA